jgi:aminopeptidase N
VLLANGNLVAQGGEGGGTPLGEVGRSLPQALYLFAVVAARLDRSQASFRTRSGRNGAAAVLRRARQAGPGRVRHGVAQARDEVGRGRPTGLEWTSDEYNIVAVGDFNAGAMENKGLNIFNTKLVLARSDISTDGDFNFIDRTVAHEYFHNWTGNRVTCRDWFQLSLKEGLTVFREQQYAGDRYSRAGGAHPGRAQPAHGQFPEDAGRWRTRCGRRPTSR